MFFQDADDTTVCYDLIAILKLRDHVLQLLLLPLLRKDNEKIKDAEDQHKRKQAPNQTPTAGVLKKQGKVIHCEIGTTQKTKIMAKGWILSKRRSAISRLAILGRESLCGRSQRFRS